jgi:hypothetical protein
VNLSFSGHVGFNPRLGKERIFSCLAMYENNFIFSLLFQAAPGRDVGVSPDFESAGLKVALEGLAA